GDGPGGFVDGGDACQRVADYEVVVEEGQGQAGHERVDPHADARELDADRVDVDAVDAAASDEAPEQRGVLDLHADGVLAERFHGLVPQRVQLARDLRDRVLGQEAADTRLDAVHH